MKNKKGEVATLLTLGLVVVGTLITLGTSLFVSNKKTNLASNSKATMSCPSPKKIYTRTAQQTCSDKCTGIPGYGYDSQNMSTLECCCKPTGSAAAGSETTLPECTFKGTLLANTECGGSSNVTSSGCGKTSSGAQTYKCKTTPADQPAAGGFSCTEGSVVDAGTNSCFSKCGTNYISGTGKTVNGSMKCCCRGAAAPAAQGVDCGMSISFASQDCIYGIDTTGCTSGTAKCKGSSSTTSGGIPGDDSTANQITTSTVTGEGQSCCFQKKGKVYVYSTYETMVNNDMLDDNGAPDCGRQSAAVIKSYQADPIGAFVCSGGTQNMTAIADYNAANPIEPEVPDVPPEDDIPPGDEVDDCVKHVGFNCKSGGYPEKFFDYYKSTAKGCESNTVGGSCYGTSKTSCSEEWNAFLKSQCGGAAPMGPEPANTGTIKCPDGTTARCTFGESAGVRGPGVCSGITLYLTGCSLAPPNSPCSDFKDIYECDGARFKMCAWDGAKCVSRTPMGQTAADNNCETITCSGGKTGQYYKGKPSTAYLFYKTPGECRDNIGAIANENTIKNAVCKSPAAAIQLDTPLDLNINTPLSALPLPADFNLDAAGQTSFIILSNPVETSTKPILNGDLTCGNYGKNSFGFNNYMPDLTGIDPLKGEVPTQCISVIESITN